MLFAVGLFMLLVTWAWTTPFGGFPDEVDHYLRAVSVGRGELVGGPNPELATTPLNPPKMCCEGNNINALSWARRGVKIVRFPARLDPARLGCEVVVVDIRRPCGAAIRPEPVVTRPTAMGAIEPEAYFVGGTLAARAGHPAAAVRLTRLGNVAVSGTLLALAVLMLWRRTRRTPAVAGFLLATTPAVMAVAASPSPNAWEASAAVAFTVAVLMVCDPGAPEPDRVLWLTLVSAGMVLAMARSLGPIWIGVVGAVGFALWGAESVRRRARAHPRPAIAAVVLVSLAALATVAWEVAVQPHARFSLGFFLEQLGPSTEDVPRTFREAIGSFGPLNNIPLPGPSYGVWLMLLGLTLATGVVLGGGVRTRVAVAAVALLVAAAFYLVSAGIMRQNGFGVQGRHLFPVYSAASLAIGYAVAVARPGREARRWVDRGAVAVALVCIGFVVVGWWTNVSGYKSSATGLVPARASWHATGLWGDTRIWAPIAVAGAGLMAAAVVLGSRESAGAEE